MINVQIFVCAVFFHYLTCKFTFTTFESSLVRTFRFTIVVSSSLNPNVSHSIFLKCNPNGPISNANLHMHLQNARFVNVNVHGKHWPKPNKANDNKIHQHIFHLPCCSVTHANQEYSKRCDAKINLVGAACSLLVHAHLK